MPETPPLASFAPEGGAVPSLREIKARAEACYIRALFEACSGDARTAARKAGVSRGHFYELLRKYGLGGKDPESCPGAGDSETDAEHATCRPDRTRPA